MLIPENSPILDTSSFEPLFFRIHHSEDEEALEQLLKSDPQIQVYDQISTQLDDLVKSLHPDMKKPGPEKLEALKLAHLGESSIQNYGVWIYYPWSKKLVHALDEEEFVKVRTNRNCYKITKEEQQLLHTKIIGIVGLSVGQSIALTLAMERTCGELRLADYDTAELSNLNRLRTGIHNLGLNKTIIAAREIAEIDPFIKVKIFNDGLHQDNMDRFFTDGGKLDLFIEVCDGLDIKIESRFKARELGIPVVMDTNDRGMIDIERFDLEPERAILHGLADGLDQNNIKDLTNEEKIPYVLKMIGADQISTRLKASMLEVEQSINTWPQLASSVTLGGALTTDVSRRLLLNQLRDSGRYYVDMEELVKDKVDNQVHDTTGYDGPPELTPTDMQEATASYTPTGHSEQLSAAQLEAIVGAAAQAPSGGNAQPWKFLYKDNFLYIFHDLHYSFSLLDYNNLGSYIGFGAMLENIAIKANSIGMESHETVFPLPADKRLIAVVGFTPVAAESVFSHLAPVIGQRMTNRTVGLRQPLAEKDKLDLISTAASIPTARLHLFENPAQLEVLAEVFTTAEKLRFIHPRGHYDTFVKELRFSKEEIESTADGLDVSTLNMKESDLAVLKIAKDPKAINLLHQWGKGNGFKKISKDAVLTASAIGVISMENHDPLAYIAAGKALERVWLESNYRNISLQPVSQFIFLNELLASSGSGSFNSHEQKELSEMGALFNGILGLEGQRHPMFIFRLTRSEIPATRALRRPLSKQLFIQNTSI